MKKLLLIVSLIAAASSVTAQSGYYYQVGDTVRGKCPIYQYEQGWWPTYDAAGHTDSVIGTTLTFGYMKHTTSAPLKVIGIASTVARLDKSDPTNLQEDLDTSVDGELYYVLFDATAGGLVEKARVCWTDDYLTHPKRYMVLPRRGGAYSCEQMFDFPAIASLREYYFDSAIIVTDSFYLGCETPCPTATEDNFTYLLSHIWDYCTYVFSETGYVDESLKPCMTEIPEFTYYDFSRLDNTWHYYTHKRFLMIFPIIELDTFCVTPDEPQVAYRDSLMVRIEWTDTNNTRWEVSRTAPNGNPDTGLITPTAVPYIEYSDINDDSVYHVYVRGYCETGILSGWSDWSTPCVIDSTPTQSGIITAEATNLDLFPNPTDGMVQIIGLQEEMTNIEVLDMTGRLLKTFEQTATFNISTLSSGIYIVRVKTYQGNETHDASPRAPRDLVTYLKLVKK